MKVIGRIRLIRDVTAHDRLFNKDQEFDYYAVEEVRMPCIAAGKMKQKRYLPHYLVFFDGLDFHIRSDAAMEIT